jgi:hypothetical protein
MAILAIFFMSDRPSSLGLFSYGESPDTPIAAPAPIVLNIEDTFYCFI